MSTNGGSSWFAATSIPHDTSGTITIRNPNTVTVNVSTSANQLNIDSGGVLTINSGIILTVPDGAGNEITVVNGSILNGPGTVKTQGAGAALNLRAGSNFNAVLNVNTGTTFAFDQTTPFIGSLYGNVSVDAGATLNGGNITGRQLRIFGTLTNNGTVTASSSGGSLRLNGSIINNGVLTTPGTLYIDSTINISGNGSFTADNTIISGNVTLLNNITYSPSTYISMLTGAVLNPNGNIFTLNSGSIYVSSGATVSASGTFKTQNTVGVYARAGSAFNAPLNVNSGITYSYDDSSPFIGSLYGNVSVDAGATLNGGNISGRQLRIFGTLTNNGTVTASSTGGSLRLKGSVLNNGVLTTPGTLYLDSTINISGNGTFTAANTIITGNVTLLSNITYSPTSYISIQTGGILNPNGNTFTLTSRTLYIDSGATVSASGTVKTQNDVGISPRTGSAFNAPLNVNTGTVYLYDLNPPYIGRYFGNVTIDAGATINCGAISARATYFYGDVLNNGTIAASSTGGSLRIKCASLINNGNVNVTGSVYFDTTTSLSGTGSFLTNPIFAGNANVTLNSSHQMNAFTINSGAIFNISNQWLKLKASNPISQSGTFNTANSTVEYNGTTLQTISTVGITYSKLRINNSSGSLLANNVTVNDSLIIQLGTLDLNGKILTVSSAGSLLESPGNVVKGSAGYLTTTRNINAPSALDVAGFGAVLTTSSNLGSTEIRRGHGVQTGGSIKRYYDITPANNSGLNATLVFKYDNSELNLRPEKSLKLFKSTNSGTNWTNMGGIVNINLNEITITGLSSFSRWTADSSGISAVINFAIQGYYNPSTNRLNKEDTVRLYLRNTSFPYSIADSAVALLDSALLKAGFVFPNALTGTYYIQIKHRNSIETWSKAGGQSYISGNTLNYDFLPAAANAYSGNQIQVDASPVRFAIYSGDVNQDGTIDASDVSDTDNDAYSSVSGYVNTDVTGDNFVDAADVSIVDNNAFNSVSVIMP
jgi:hypothetical protein